MSDRDMGHQIGSQWLLRLGVLLFLLGLINGFFVHGMALPRLALAAHLMAVMGAGFLIGVGLMWPRLQLGPGSRGAAFGLAVYGFYGGWLTYLFAAIRGAGGMLPLSSGQSRGAAFDETLVMIGLTTIAAALIALGVLLLFGLRKTPFTARDEVTLSSLNEEQNS